MKINLKSGIAELLFGMKESDVKKLYGEPERQFKDEDKNVIYLYNSRKLRLTFYSDEDFRLGYIIGSHPELELAGSRIINNKWAQVFAALNDDKKLIKFEKETQDTVDLYFNEANWIIFHVEFDDIIKVELGAIINDKDEFAWKF